MASGFINDSNQLQAEMYKVIITMSNSTYYPSASATVADNGGVTPNTADGFATLPTTTVKGLNRARGNMRFRNIVNRLTGLSDCQIRDITITEADGDAQATSLQFTVLYERPAFIPVTGTAIDGSTAITTTAIALRNAVSQGIRDATTGLMRAYDPSLPGDTEVSVSVSQTGATATQTFGTVAVTLIDESTLFD
jgi:uncharacterized protein YjiS (DUF1127 family)